MRGSRSTIHGRSTTNPTNGTTPGVCGVVRRRAMAASWRTVRVFLSSTFRDMHAERDHLVKVTFPRLRQRLLPFRVELTDIDLRWGITAEDALEGQALTLCLEQVDECRPFFVG